jgi:ABC-type phosphate/phosphonate transport system substrate-binding protein
MTKLVASLGMYDSPATRAANDDLWTGIARRLRAGGIDDVPDGLDRSRALDQIWSDPSLLLAQTCGYPLITQWRGQLRYVATPRYDVPGCDGTSHRSRIIVRAGDDTERLGDYRSRTVAVNDFSSNTGMNLLRAASASLASGGAFFEKVVETGSHAASARKVADGEADIAAIDAVTFAHLEREEAAVTGRLRTLGWTAPSPALPFVTSSTSSDALVRLLRKALRETIADRPATANALFLDSIEVIGIRRYDVISTMEKRATTLGYGRLA